MGLWVSNQINQVLFEIKHYAKILIFYSKAYKYASGLFNYWQ